MSRKMSVAMQINRDESESGMSTVRHNLLAYLGQELDNPRLLHRRTGFTEVPLRHEAPVQGPSDPILQTLHVQVDHLVDLWSPRGEVLAVVGESVDGLAAHLPNVVDGFLACLAVVVHEDDDQVVGVAARLFDVVGKDIVRPSYQVVRTLVESLDGRVSDDLLRELEIQAVFDEIEDGFAAAVVASEVDVRFDIRNDAFITIAGLDVDGFEEHAERFLESVLNSGLGIFDASHPVISSQLARVNLLFGLRRRRVVQLRAP